VGQELRRAPVDRRRPVVVLRKVPQDRGDGGELRRARRRTVLGDVVVFVVAVRRYRLRRFAVDAVDQVGRHAAVLRRPPFPTEVPDGDPKAERDGGDGSAESSDQNSVAFGLIRLGGYRMIDRKRRIRVELDGGDVRNLSLVVLLVDVIKLILSVISEFS
jgi:hypothetical protein